MSFWVATVLRRFWRPLAVIGSEHSQLAARYILVSIYMPHAVILERVLEAGFEQRELRPWIDLDRGLYFRVGEDRPSAAVPWRLLSHMRRWHRKGAIYALELHGRRASPQMAVQAIRNIVEIG